tara:strand:+ start:858 stop:1037 length:180 start_codon:yes stop_codon:yes gene_type:complete
MPTASLSPYPPQEACVSAWRGFMNMFLISVHKTCGFAHGISSPEKPQQLQAGRMIPAIE